MLLSKLSTDESADIMVQVAPHIEELVNDEKLIDMLKNRKTTSDRSEAAKFGILTAFNVSIYLLKEHRKTVWNIVGVLNEKTPEEIGAQLFPVTVKQLVDILTDKDFRSFFTPSA